MKAQFKRLREVESIERQRIIETDTTVAE